MDLGLWLLWFGGNCLLSAWVLRGGGAEWMAGWKSSFFIDCFLAPGWTAEQIKLYVLLFWIGQTLWFLAGLFLCSGRRFAGPGAGILPHDQRRATDLTVPWLGRPQTSLTWLAQFPLA